MQGMGSSEYEQATTQLVVADDQGAHSQWYCMQGSGLDDKYGGILPDEVAIKKIQDSMYYYLVRDEKLVQDEQAKEETTTTEEKVENKEPNELFSAEMIDQEDGTVTTKYNRLVQKENELVYFTVHIPDIKKKLLVSRELLILESKVFEGMLNSDMLEAQSNEMSLQMEQTQEGEKSSCEYFDLALRFIHVGCLGVAESCFTKTDPEVLGWKDLLGLLRVADEYQIESLSRAISRVVNQFNALTIGLTCLEFSADCKSIILPMVCDVLAFNPASVVSDMVYSGQPLELPKDEDVKQYLEDPTLALKEYPFLDTPLVPPLLHKILATPLMEPLSKIIISLPLELFEGMISSAYSILKPNELMVFVTLWMLQDMENRYLDAYRLISQNIDWSLCESELLYMLIYFVFIGIGKTMPQYKSTCDEAHDRLHMSLFRKSTTISDEEWEQYNVKMFPNKEAHHFKKAKKELRHLILGLDASGKTTILYKLKLDEVVTTIPTIGFNVETVSFKGVDITMWDVGGGGKIKSLWRHYYQGTNCVIYVVDSNDRDRIEEASEEFHNVCSDEQLADSSFLILANKQDLPNAMSISEIVDKMKLHSLSIKKWYIQACCGVTGEGVYEGLDWSLKSSEATVVMSSDMKRYPHFGSLKFN